MKGFGDPALAVLGDPLGVAGTLASDHEIARRVKPLVNRYRRVARTVLEAGLPSPSPWHGATPEFAAGKVAAEVAAAPRKDMIDSA